MTKRTRRTFTKEYKAEVVTLIRQGNKSIGAVCRDLGLPETAVRAYADRNLSTTLRHSFLLFSEQFLLSLMPRVG